MFKKFQLLINNILESNSAGEGGALGTPETPIYNPPNDIQSGDKYSTGDNRNIFGGVFSKKTTKKSSKKSKNKKKKPLIIKRNLPKKDL